MSDEIFLNGMILLRFLSACIEFTGAFLMWRYYRLDMAIRINGFLGLAGPIILTTTMMLGIAGLAASRVPVAKIVWIGLGVACILWGTTR
ncbi:YqhV family protein [Sulfobacillus harzensis]|uniref:YqhV family protein n=1 Tax=Sulfobacillus harzensis TaxID=2729629 RepID=A0A7Y0L7X6_9FIRM|nr:YqhV family protein [Sulfobacillus harzensis]NMP24959.1 YqhV family protein [Sulfobacillus harzensis]